MISDLSQSLQEQVTKANESQLPLQIQGGNSKAFYGQRSSNALLELADHQGVTNYAPTELVITALAGTPLSTIEKLLDEHNQMLGFEPPYFGPQATIGGTIACNFSGPRRAYLGAARDFLLGTKVLNGKGEILSFGGEVMKNVAGYDASRLMAGAMGTLGALLEISLKVLPKPEHELTLSFALDTEQALAQLQTWSRKPLPISATCIEADRLYVRLSGTEKGLNAAQKTMGGETMTGEMEDAEKIWQQLKEQQSSFFKKRSNEQTLWRISVAAGAKIEQLSMSDNILYEWGGALRWLKSDAGAQELRQWLSLHQGHVIAFRKAQGYEDVTDLSEPVFQPLTPALNRLHQNLKQAFDPNGILNPKQMYSDF